MDGNAQTEVIADLEHSDSNGRKHLVQFFSYTNFSSTGNVSVELKG